MSKKILQLICRFLLYFGDYQHRARHMFCVCVVQDFGTEEIESNNNNIGNVMVAFPLSELSRQLRVHFQVVPEGHNESGCSKLFQVMTLLSFSFSSLRK